MFKVDKKNVKFSTRFCLGCISDGFTAIDSREVSLGGNVYDFSVDYNSGERSEILNIHKYSMTYLALLHKYFFYYWDSVALQHAIK